MNIELDLYRVRIGTHYHCCRIKVRRVKPCNVKQWKKWELPTEHISWQQFDPPVWLHLASGKARLATFLAALYLTVLPACVLKPQLSMKNLHDLSARMMLAGDVSPNPGPVYDCDYFPFHSVNVPQEREAGVHDGLGNLMSQLRHAQALAAWAVDQVQRLWYTVQYSEAQWRAHNSANEQQIVNLQYDNAVLRYEINCLQWEIQRLGGIDSRVCAPAHPPENVNFSREHNHQGTWNGGSRRQGRRNRKNRRKNLGHQRQTGRSVCNLVSVPLIQDSNVSAPKNVKLGIGSRCQPASNSRSRRPQQEGEPAANLIVVTSHSQPSSRSPDPPADPDYTSPPDCADYTSPPDCARLPPPDSSLEEGGSLTSTANKRRTIQQGSGSEVNGSKTQSTVLEWLSKRNSRARSLDKRKANVQRRRYHSDDRGQASGSRAVEPGSSGLQARNTEPSQSAGDGVPPRAGVWRGRLRNPGETRESPPATEGTS